LDLIKSVLEKTTYSAIDIQNLIAGQKVSLKIHGGGGGVDEILNVEVPSGKKWEFVTSIKALETDA